jgi:hypothetical protein
MVVVRLIDRGEMRQRLCGGAVANIISGLTIV